MLSRLREYANRRKLEIHEQLGGGIQGVVYSTYSTSALKAFKEQSHFEQEVKVYQRLKERNVTNVCGFAVPRPISYNPHLLVIEMEVVNPPFVVDFASAGVDAPLYEYTPEIMAEWEESRQELFEENWPTVLKVIAGFRVYGIYLSDVKPGNIMFG